MTAQEHAIYCDQLEDLFEAALVEISDILPSVWYELVRIMAPGSAFPGPFSYDRTPYCRELVDHLHPSSPYNEINIMKGAQMGMSSGVIEPGVGYIISQQPSNTALLVGHSELADEAMNIIDAMIKDTGLSELIRPSVIRKRNSKTGDTNKMKEFVGGYFLVGASTNHKLLMQRSIRNIFNDDYDAAQQASKSDGSTDTLIDQRMAAHAAKRKRFNISTPRLKQSSNILPAFLRGDQRYYNVPCPCCHSMIDWKWRIEIPGTNEVAGIYYELDNHNRLIDSSVGYVCQNCGGFFTDKTKKQMLNDGLWIPTATALKPTIASYQIPALYAPPGMFDWKHYVNQYLEANPPGGATISHLDKTFTNLCLGLPYEEKPEGLQAHALQRNCRNYTPGTVPDKQSHVDGNGPIVFLSLAADCNGVEDDARIDYEIVAHARSGATYSVQHGSVGTFQPAALRHLYEQDREILSYKNNAPNSVWNELEKILLQPYITDDDKRMPVLCSGLDVGYLDKYVWPFINKMNERGSICFGVKGKDAPNKFTPLTRDRPTFQYGKSAPNLFLIEINNIKDSISDYSKMNWKPNVDSAQPPGFMNFPSPAQNQYQYSNYFSHYEAEERQPEIKDGLVVGFMWKKRNSAVQNHLFDCRVYNLAVRDIFMAKIFTELKIKGGTWQELADMMLGA